MKLNPVKAFQASNKANAEAKKANEEKVASEETMFVDKYTEIQPQHEDSNVAKLEAVEPLVTPTPENKNQPETANASPEIETAANDVAAPQEADVGSAMSDGVAIDKVRELLFGETIRAQKDELQINHRKILQRVEALHKVTGKRIDALSKNLEALRKTLSQETKDREGCVTKLNAELSQSEDTLRKDVKAMQESLTATEAGIREELDKGSADYTAALVETEEKLITRINEQFENLKEQKVSRGNFAEMLRSMAESLDDADTK